MNPEQTIHNFYNSPKDKKREIGKYHASELWAIYKGYTTTGNFFTGKSVDKQGQAMMFRGSAFEDMYAKVLTAQKVKFKQQERLEIEIAKDIFISGKTDFSFKDFIIETKCPNKETSGIPDKWTMQCELYYRASKKQVYLGIFHKDGEDIIKFYKYAPSNELWETMQKTIIDFHNRLKKRYDTTKR